MEEIRVLCCRSVDGRAAIDPVLGAALAAVGDRPVDWVGPRPGKQIDALLTGRVVVLGDDADLAAVALRLQRRDLLGSVSVGYATGRATPVTTLYSLPVGAAAVDLAVRGDPDLVPLVRDDVGGVLVGRAVVSPVQGTVYVDEHRVLRGPAHGLIIYPDPRKGLEVTVVPRRLLGVGRRPRDHAGRAVQIGTLPAQVISDGVTFERPMTRWTFYRHTEPLRLVRGLV